MVAGHVYGWVARLDDAIDRLTQARDHAVALGQDSELPYIYLWLVAARCWKGELAEATSLADEALAIATVLVDPAAMAYADSAVAWAAAHTGDVRRTREHAGRALAFMEFARWHSSLFWPLGAFALVAAAEEDPESVERYLGSLTDAALAIGLEEPACAPFLPDRVEGLVALGQLDRAAGLVAHWDTDARRLDRDWAIAAGARCRAVLLVARHELDAAASAIDEALSAIARLPMPIEHGRILLVAADIQRRRRERRAARDTLAAAADVFGSVGAGLWLARAERQRDRLGLQASPMGELSPSEDRIARLAASGLTNREIAARLDISPKTVEANLARAYGKLGLHSRAQLGAWASGRRPSDR